MTKFINSNYQTKNSKGFTLIELLVVIAIIGILASFLVANYIGVRARSRDAQRKGDLRQIQSSLEFYRSDSGSYPAALPACGSSLSFGGNVYMRKIPCDPINSSPLTYIYQSAFSNLAYTIAACLENTNDQNKDQTNNPPSVSNSSSITSCAGGNTNWSYTILSP